MLGSAPNSKPVKIFPARRGGSPNWIFHYDKIKPPDIFFDTNVWIGMSTSDLSVLTSIQGSHGFRYRYSITIELNII